MSSSNLLENDIKRVFESDVKPVVDLIRFWINDFEKELNVEILEMMEIFESKEERSVDTNFPTYDLTKPVTPHSSTRAENEKNTNVIAPGMFRIDSTPVNSYFENNKNVNKDYLDITKKHTAALQYLLHQASASRPSDRDLEYACIVSRQIQELFYYACVSCPSAHGRKVNWAPDTWPETNNKPRAVTSQETSIQSTQRYVAKNNIQQTNIPLLPFTGLEITTNASGLHPKRNRRNNKVPQTSSSCKKNKQVKVHPWNVKSISNMNNYVSDYNVNVKHVVLNSNVECVCSTCDKCVIYANHDVCVTRYLNDAKKPKRKNNKEWKPSRIFTIVGYRWQPTGRTLTKVGNEWKPMRKPPPRVVLKWIPKETNASSSVAPIIEISRNSNILEPTKHWGSNFSKFPSSSSFRCRSYKSSFGT
ncbi:hypothetical protein Tco_1165884 [Tanacetum coccineum]